MGTQPRTTLQLAAILRHLADHPGTYGLDIVRSSGYPGGSVYPVLHRLERLGWVRSELEGIDECTAGRRKRRYFWLTDRGQVEAAAILAKARKQLGEH